MLSSCVHFALRNAIVGEAESGCENSFKEYERQELVRVSES